MKEKNSYRVLGLMSGTSLDGLDLAYCIFKKLKKGWSYEIVNSVTVKYSSAWLSKLSKAHLLSAADLLALDSEYGTFLGNACNDFLEKYNARVDFVASHGHTIFHQPERKFTYQLGNGNALHAVLGLPVIYDFRTMDVMKGGEGAPLVPAGDKVLFAEYDVCLNLGGIANLSADIKRERLAYDICFCNMGLNYLAAKNGKVYDKNGAMAEAGEINKKLLSDLNKIYDRIRKKRPSLGRELFEKQVQPLLDNENISLNDRLRTVTESSAKEIADAILSIKKNASVLCTGGGAFNSFLVSRMLDYCGDDASLIIPEENVVKFKEAMVFAFLGVLRVRNEVNALKSVTHASTDSSGGVQVGF